MHKASVSSWSTKSKVDVIRDEEEYGACRAIWESLQKLKRVHVMEIACHEKCALCSSSGPNLERAKGN
jgi:hypothetical protein